MTDDADGIGNTPPARGRTSGAGGAPDASPGPVVAVRGSSPADEATVRALAARLGSDPEADPAADPKARRARRADADRETTGRGPAAPPWTLLVDGERRVLVRPDGVRLEIDFVGGRTGARRHEGGLARQPLARALGVPGLRKRLGRAPAVVDATGGLGRDAWFAAALGCPVVLIERSPIVHALLESALARAAANASSADVAARVTLIAGDATAVLPGLDRACADVVYLDPMYPPVRRRAAVTKGMQFLHALLGPPESGDDARLLVAALAAAGSRVTVKRPSGAPPLAGDDAFTGRRSRIESPGTRYDVYLVDRGADDAVSRESSGTAAADRDRRP